MVPVLPPGVPVPLREVPAPLLLHLSVETVAAGFPSPADDYVDASIDLNIELIPCPTATFFMRVEGDSKQLAAETKQAPWFLQAIKSKPVMPKAGTAPKKAPSRWDKIDEDDIIDTMRAQAANGYIH